MLFKANVSSIQTSVATILKFNIYLKTDCNFYIEQNLKTYKYRHKDATANYKKVMD